MLKVEERMKGSERLLVNPYFAFSDELLASLKPCALLK